MSNKVYGNGSAEFFAASGDIVALYSKDDTKIYTRTGFPPSDAQWALLVEVPANTEYATSAFSARTEVRIAAGASDVAYQVGTAAVVLERKGERGQGTPGVLNATGALTAAMVFSGIVTSTTAAAVAATLPTGAVMDAAIDMSIGESFDWSAINTGDTNAFTVTAAATGHTVVGIGAVAAETSALFRTRKTAAATFITYRIG